MMTDKEDIHRRVDRLLAGIKRFQSRHQGDSENTIINRPVKPFEIKDFENYPYDYQYFMLTIGELYVGTAGYLALCINKPVVAGDINPLYTEVSEVVNLLDGEFEFSALQKDLLLFYTEPCDYVYLAFNPSTIPYSVVEPDWDEKSKLDFQIGETIFLSAVENQFTFNGSLADCMTSDLNLNNKFTLLEQLKIRGSDLAYANDELKSDREIVLTAVENDGYALKYASGRLKCDREIALTAVKNNGSALQYVSDELRGNREIVLTALKNNVRCLEYADDEL
ncbi:MAG: DUF4116 domain-containing protein, partial [Methylococcales bacterium]|nr:DUF4116 domain-containing protein [Methylococcales bacterium]